MKLSRTRLNVLPLALAVSAFGSAFAQEGPTHTQALVGIESKSAVTPAPSNFTLKVENHATPVTSITHLPPTGAQIALLIDDGLRVSVGRELVNIRKFIQSLPVGTEIFVGYMQNGRVVPVQNFTTDLAIAAQTLRLPTGLPGESASPYLCLSDFVKSWSSDASDSGFSVAQQPRKARIVLMITDGVDPYNGSTSVLNQDSPYVASAVTDAQRRGIPVYSIFFSDAGIRGGRADFSGQSYLSQVAEGTGGRSYYNGTGNPVSIAPYLADFQKDLSETYVATFDAPTSKNLVRLKLSSTLSGTKVRAPDEVHPGTIITGSSQ
jgi:hypothetical protein